MIHHFVSTNKFRNYGNSMIIINDPEQIREPFKNPVLTIGNFDGVHKGHLALFDRVKKTAKGINGESVVMTFEPHPIKVVRPGNGPPLITPFRQKVGLISEAGIDVLICIPFNPEFARTSARDFIGDMLVNRIGVKEIVVGYDYSFGKDRSGGIQQLREMGAELGYGVQVVGPVYINDTLVSSTSIRNFISEGNLSGAKMLLGRDYRISGIVRKGMGRGASQLGFPTANLLPEDELIPKKGVYAVFVNIDGVRYSGVCNIGNNPTFGGTALSIETHVLDYSRDLLEKEITIIFAHWLRDEKNFSGIEELIDQIKKDITKAKGLLAGNE